MSPNGYSQRTRARKSCSSPGTARPTQSAASRRWRKFWPSPSARPRSTKRYGASSTPKNERLAGLALLGAQAEHHLVRALVAERTAEQIALDRIAAEVAHPLEILRGFDAFRGHRHPEGPRELNDRLNDRHIFRPRSRFANEASVDLQLMEHRLVQIA